MKQTTFHLVFVILAFVGTIQQTAAQGSSFTYQGRLIDQGTPANGSYDLQFHLFDMEVGASPIGAVTNENVAVSNGIFTVTLDFGAVVFDGAPRWLEIGVRPGTNTGAFATLNPRQRVTPSPYAIYASNAGTANTAANITGTLPDARLSPNIARLSVSNTAVQAMATPIITSGFITGATVTKGGSGYLTAPSVTVNDTTGSGATITAAISNGAVVSLTVQTAGIGYSPATTLTIDPPPSNAYQIFQSTNFFSGVNTLTNPNNIIAGNGAALTALNASQLTSGIVPDAQLAPNIARTGQVWLLNGNPGTTAGIHFLGTTDDQPLELRAKGRRVSRLEPTTDLGTARSNMVNVINGSSVNSVAPGVRGATVSGGGAGFYDGISYTNSVAADLGTIAGGAGNTLQFLSDGSSIGGGSRNRVLGAYNATIAGGVDNTIQSGAVNAAIGGGQFNLIQTNGIASTIGGGLQNSIQTLAYNNNIGGYNSTVAGGLGNVIGSPYATIGGGGYNSVGTNSNTATISGGYGNTIANHSWDVTISGGSYHSIGSNSYFTTIGGGQANTIGNGASASTIAGGFVNAVQSSAIYSTIGGGQQNTIGTNAGYATIAGGLANTVRSNASYAFIAGGANNSALGRYSFAGGRNAQANHDGSFVWGDSSGAPVASTGSNQFIVRAGGGVQFLTGTGGTTGGVVVDGGTVVTSATLSNQAWTVAGNRGLNPTNGNFLGTIDNQPFEVKVWNRRAFRVEPATNSDLNFNFAPNIIGGHQSNSIAPGIVGATIAGGGRFDNSGQDLTHHINAHHGTIGGGDRNTVNGVDGTIAGGGGNWAAGGYSTVAGGLFNSVYSNSVAYDGFCAAVGGGTANAASGEYATIPGGYLNSAGGNYSFAAGHQAKANHDGAFVWADGLFGDFSSTANNQFLIRASGNVGINTASPGAALEVRTTNTSGNVIRFGFYTGGAGNLIAGPSRVGIATDSMAEKISINQGTGNVGINTISPQTQLHVVGPDGLQLRLQNSANNRFWTIYSESFNDSGNLLFVPSAGAFGYIRRTDGAYLSGSDERLKRDITPLGNVLDRLLQLRPVTYHFRNQPENTPRTLGLIAQEVEPLFPEVVGEHAGMKSLAYSELIPVAIGAVQELNQKLTSELKRRDAENADLRQKNESLETRLARLERIILNQKSN